MVVFTPSPDDKEPNRRIVSKQHLTPSRARLVEMMQRLNFGRIEQLRVARGEPEFNPPPKVTREVKFGADNGSRAESALRDFTLKAEVCEMLDQIVDIGDGVVEVLIVKHGLPFSMHVVEPSAGTRH